MALSREGAHLVNELGTLEVSTLVVAAPSGAKPPSLETQLKVIGEQYRTFAAEKAARFSGPEGAPRRAAKAMSFEELADWAEGVLSRADQAPAGASRADARATIPRGEDEGLLRRIAHYGKRLEGVEPRSATPADAIVVRKGYELGLEPIRMSTKVSLDGDLITQFTSADGEPPDPALQRFHGTLVGVGLDQWQGLMGAVAAFLRTALGFFLR
jgi:hypothetical protein